MFCDRLRCARKEQRCRLRCRIQNLNLKDPDEQGSPWPLQTLTLKLPVPCSSEIQGYEARSQNGRLALFETVTHDNSGMKITICIGVIGGDLRIKLEGGSHQGHLL